MKKIVWLFFAATCTAMFTHAQTPPLCPVNPGGVPWTPSWHNAPGILYTVCPEDVKVGIGTDEPRTTLDVIGTTQTVRLAIGLDPIAMVGRFHLKASGLSPSNNSTIFLVENTQRRLLQLSNQGLLQTREVKVDLQNWPDYVFTADYSLMPLWEVEKFIQREGHLPKVPPAAQIEAEGLELGVMNKLLMEKVEELTLYLIEQEKRLQELQRQVEELDAKNK